MKWWLLMVAACGRFEFAEQRGDGSTDTLTITAPTTALPETAQKFTASGPVTWSASAGSIDANGVFTAPATEQLVTITAATPSQSVESTIDVTLTVTPTTIANTGNLISPSGMASQTHGFYSTATGEWWVFFSDNTSRQLIQARRSVDFATWSGGYDVDIGHAIGDGRDLAVAHRVLNGHEIVHIAESYEATRGRVHVRAELTASDGLTYGAPKETNNGGVITPDGPAVAITSTGQVIDATGYLPTPQNPPLTPCGDGDQVMYTSNANDDGTTNFDSMTYKQEVIWCVGNRVNARWLTSDGDTIYSLYEDGENDPQPVNVLMSVRKNSTWLPLEPVYTLPPSVFGTDDAFDIDDWSATVIGRTIHVLRRNGTTQSAEHATIDLDTGAIAAGPTMPVFESLGGTGVVAVPYGTGLLAVILSRAIAANAVYAFWDGASWSNWHELDVGMQVKTSLAAIPDGPGGKPALLWTVPAMDVLVGAALP